MQVGSHADQRSFVVDHHCVLDPPWGVESLTDDRVGLGSPAEVLAGLSRSRDFLKGLGILIHPEQEVPNHLGCEVFPCLTLQIFRVEGARDL